MNSIKILNISEETVFKYKSCFDQNGSPKNEANIFWQFINRPNFKRYVDIAFDEINNKTAAIYAVAPVIFKIEEKMFVGTQSLDTITDSDYRGNGWFIKLANNVYQKTINDGVSLVYGFPNGNSIHGFEKKLNWTLLDPVPFLIKPLRSKYFTNKIKLFRFVPNINLFFSKKVKSKTFNLIENREIPQDINRLWQKFSEKIVIAVDRNKEYLDWRYIQKPNEDYKIVHCFDSMKNYMGLVVFTIKEKHEGKIGYIMELIYDLNCPEAGKLLLKHANYCIQKGNADCILSWCMEHSPCYPLYKNEYFFKMPEKLRPIELHFGVRAFKEEFKHIVEKRKNWFISYSDSDTV